MPAARRPRLVVPGLLPERVQPRWWEGTQAGYDQGYHALDPNQPLPKPPTTFTAEEKTVWWMGYRTAHPLGFRDRQEGLPLTLPPDQPEHIWPDDEDGA
ncbi:MAG TPA: hypothetical protein VFI41_12565 [Gemmatimonadales bacterium]|nr:hypothetical protein [Gemmatimonadales bacterium]